MIFLCPLAVFAAGPRIELVWPTPNTAYLEGKPIDAYVQPTVSGEVTSGLFGCARSGGGQFHEGVDLKPVSRDRKGEPTDDVFATMTGVVRHINKRSGESSYGRYIVIEHPDLKPAVYTLYAHLSAVSVGLNPGDTVQRGQVIATMGRSAGGYAIPKDRAHLHYEIGLMMTRQFQSWYDWKKFGSPNEQGLYNGMNLMAVNALDFFNEFRARRVNNFTEYFAQLPAVARVRIATTRTPDFVQRYPELLTTPVPMGGVAGWEMKVNATGIPFSWTPLAATDVIGFRANEIRLSEVDADAIKRFRCKSIAVSRRGEYTPGRDLDTMLQLVFGVR
ncbi:M23 family metallopeptidase [Rariglobus hedericola]|uniref:M23 family metallopeptidase n=1 Tax=Rariglobus hedericola TaxID=2597822 RepID=UPI0039ED942C